MKKDVNDDEPATFSSSGRLILYHPALKRMMTDIEAGKNLQQHAGTDVSGQEKTPTAFHLVS